MRCGKVPSQDFSAVASQRCWGRAGGGTNTFLKTWGGKVALCLLETRGNLGWLSKLCWSNEQLPPANRPLHEEARDLQFYFQAYREEQLRWATSLRVSEPKINLQTLFRHTFKARFYSLITTARPGFPALKQIIPIINLAF